MGMQSCNVGSQSPEMIMLRVLTTGESQAGNWLRAAKIGQWCRLYSLRECRAFDQDESLTECMYRPCSVSQD